MKIEHENVFDIFILLCLLLKELSLFSSRKYELLHLFYDFSVVF